MRRLFRRSGRLLPAVFWTAMVLAIVACVSSPEPEPVPAVPAGLSDRDYREAAARGEPVYRIDPDTSVVRIFVYRDGVLARLGHDHVVTARDIRGYAWLPARGEIRADLSLAVADLVVDDQQARKAAGFTTEVSEADRNGTYRNMLLSLEANRYPAVRLHVTVPSDHNPADPETTVDLTLHGVTLRLDVAAHIVNGGDGFRATGAFRIAQTDFGMTPFSVFGGALAVRDELELQFELEFEPYQAVNGSSFDARK